MRKPKPKAPAKSPRPARPAKAAAAPAPSHTSHGVPVRVTTPEFPELQRARTGRPNVTYTPEAAQTICDRVSAGMSVRQACFDMPFDRVTVYRWARTIPEFRTAFERARELNLDGMVDDMQEIADNGTNDWYVFESASGKEFVKLNDEAVRRSQLRLEARYRILGAMRAQQWGKKLDVTSGGQKIDSFAAALMAAAKDTEARIDGDTAQQESPALVAH